MECGSFVAPRSPAPFRRAMPPPRCVQQFTAPCCISQIFCYTVLKLTSMLDNEGRREHRTGYGLEIPIGVGFNPILRQESPMRSTQQMSITLPNDMAEMVREKVAAGEYASESEVIRDGLRTLAARDKAIEKWLRDQVVPAARALKADPSRALTVAQVRERLARQRRPRQD